MSSQKTLDFVTGIFLVLFFFILVSIYFFGLTDSITGNLNMNFFRIIYFFIIISFLGLIYKNTRAYLPGIPGHVFAVLSIFLLAITLSNFIGNLKSVYDTKKYVESNVNLDAMQSLNNYYSEYALNMKKSIDSIQTSNNALKKEIDNIDKRIEDRKPIFVETVYTLPAETVYEDYYEDYESHEYEDDDFYEHEEDDD